MGTTEPNQAYQVFLSQTLMQEGATDSAGQSVGVDTTTPPPSTWGLILRGGRGAFREEAGTAQYQIRIPNNTNLIGQTFYAVTATDSDGDGIFDRHSDPITVSITAS
jgi:hypothetical protein